MIDCITPIEIILFFSPHTGVLFTQEHNMVTALRSLRSHSFTKLTAIFIMLENCWILITLYMKEKFKCLDKKRKAEG